jgi:hypothetical protein
MKSNQLIIKQDLAEPNYRFFQLLAESENGLIEEEKIINGKKLKIKCSYKTQLGQISRTTADLQILLAALVRQNGYKEKIEDISQKDLLFYLNKEPGIKNYKRLRTDLELLMSLSINIESDDKKDLTANRKKENSNDEAIGYPVVIVKYKLKKYQRKDNYIVCAEEFVNQVKNKYIIPLPPKEVFFKLNTPTKYVCERLIARLQPKGIGKGRKFKSQKLEFDIDYFASEILGYQYKRAHSKRNTTNSVLKELDFLVKDFKIEKMKAGGQYKVHIWFYPYYDYKTNVEQKRNESKYYEDELFPKEEIVQMEKDKPTIFHSLINEGVSERKANIFLNSDFDIIDNQEIRDKVISEFKEKELSFFNYIESKLAVAKIYKDKKLRMGEEVSFEGVISVALRDNWEDSNQKIKAKKEKINTEKKEKEEKTKAIEKNKDEIFNKWEKIIRPEINKIIDQNPEIVGELHTEIEESRDWRNPLYDVNLTPLENYKTKMLIRADIDAKIIERNDKLKEIIEQRDKELAEIE